MKRVKWEWKTESGHDNRRTNTGSEETHTWDEVRPFLVTWTVPLRGRKTESGCLVKIDFRQWLERVQSLYPPS